MTENIIVILRSTRTKFIVLNLTKRYHVVGKHCFFNLKFQIKKAKSNERKISLSEIIIIISLGFIIASWMYMIFWVLVEKPKEDDLKEKLKLTEENERLRDREILRSIYANQKLQMFDNDGSQAKPFAQEILKLIGELKSFS